MRLRLNLFSLWSVHFVTLAILIFLSRISASHRFISVTVTVSMWLKEKLFFNEEKKTVFVERVQHLERRFFCFYCEGGILKEKQRMLSKRKSKVWKETTKAQRKKWDIMFCRERLNRNRNWYATKQINGMRFFFLHSTYEGKNVTTYIKVSSVQHFVLIVTKERKKTNDNRWKITVKWENCVKSENIIYSPILSRFVGLFLNMALDGPGVDCEPYILIT